VRLADIDLSRERSRWREVAVLEVVGTPVAQPRARAATRLTTAGRLRTFVHDSGASEFWKRSIMLAASDARGRLDRYDGPARVDADFFFSRPKYLLRRLDSNGSIYKPTKPDRDNLDKAVLDALTECGWFRDDSRVASGLIEKWFLPKSTSTPGAVIRVSILD